MGGWRGRWEVGSWGRPDLRQSVLLEKEARFRGVRGPICPFIKITFSDHYIPGTILCLC